MRHVVRAIAISALFVAGAEGVQAALITSTGAIGSATTVDFSEFSGPFAFTPGPLQVGTPVGEDIVYSASGNSAVGDGDTTLIEYHFSTNGKWNVGRNGFVGIDADDGASITFTFNDGPVSKVGGFVNYSPSADDDFIIQALAADLSVLESYNISLLAPIVTPDALNDGAFRGILRASDDIAAFRIVGGFGALDDLTFGRGPNTVPEPASLALFSLGAMGLAGYARRRRAAPPADVQA